MSVVNDDVAPATPNNAGTPKNSENSSYLESWRERVDIQVLEALLVRAFCAQRHINWLPNAVLADAISNVGDELASEFEAGLPTKLRIDDLVQAFEMLVPAQQAQAHGAVFTPSEITRFMAAEVLGQYFKNSTSDILDGEAMGETDEPRAIIAPTVIDPAVGCGALLAAILVELVGTYHLDAGTAGSCLYGSDITPQAVRQARLLLNAVAADLGATNAIDAHIEVRDALDIDGNGEDGKAGPGGGAGRDDGGAVAGWPKQFDVVIGNPPYVRYQHLAEDLRERLGRERESCGFGNYNLYFPFFEIAWNLLDEGGSFALITPNGYFTSASGKPLRTYLRAHRVLDAIVDFGPHMVFEGVMTYTAISFANKRGRLDGADPGEADEATGVRYVELDGISGLRSLDADWRETACITAKGADMTPARWQLVGKSKRSTITAISQAGRRMDEVANVSYGLATLRDKLYMIDLETLRNGYYHTTYEGVRYRIEESLVKTVIKVSRGGAGARGIIYPYIIKTEKSVQSAHLMAEDTLHNTCPEAYTYLQAIKGELAKRDKGKRVYAAWYAYGRTQGLTGAADGLVTPLYSKEPRFERPQVRPFLFINGALVTVTDAQYIDLDTLGYLLNSTVCKFYMESTSNSISGGYYAYQKRQLGGFGIPRLSGAQKAKLREFEDKDERDCYIQHIYGVSLPGTSCTDLKAT